MIYIIGGVSRSGKSLVRKRLLEKYKISGLSLDLIRGAIQRGMPELGIASGQDNSYRTEKLWPLIQGLIDEFYYFNEDIVIEGVNLDPNKLAKYRADPNFRICFLGYPNISVEKKFEQLRKLDGEFEWTRRIKDEKLHEYTLNNIEKSRELEKICSELGFQFFDNSENILDKVENIADWLVQKK